MADFLLLLFYSKIVRIIFKFAVCFISLEIFILSKATFLLYKKLSENLQTSLMKSTYEAGIGMNIGHKITKVQISADYLQFHDQEL